MPEERIELEDTSMGVVPGQGADANALETVAADGGAAGQASKPAAEEASEESWTLAMAVLARALCNWYSHRRGWQPVTTEELADMAPPATRILLRLFPELRTLPVAADVVALGGAVGSFIARRDTGTREEGGSNRGEGPDGPGGEIPPHLLRS